MATSSPTLKPESSNNARVRSVGFPRSSQSAPANSGASATQRAAAPNLHARPTPQKRAKGRFFIATILLSVIASLSYVLWNELVRYAAYGTIEGRIIPVACPWTGFIEQVLVEDGQQVARGQLVAKINSAELRIRLAKLNDDIRLAEAALETRKSELQSRQRELEIERLRSQAEFDQLHSQLHSERAKLAELKVHNQAITQLEYRGVIPNVEASQSSSAYEGQLQRVRTLEQAIARYKDGLENLGASPSSMVQTADASKLETLIDERERLIKYQLLGEIRAPIDGRICQVSHWAGEFVEQAEPLFEILEQGSLRAVLYVQQSSADDYAPQQSIDLLLPPNRQSANFVIERIDDETRCAPTNLSRYFRKDERLVRVIARPTDSELQSTQNSKPVWIGAEVRMPHRWLGFAASSGSIASTLSQSPE
ncbi:MAG: HlyD family efflux transporter periplasmic adaptor subunit [Pirellulales bacterium]